MNKCTLLFISPLLILLSSGLMVSERSDGTMETTISTLANSLEGEWSVEEYVGDDLYNQVGTLTIDEGNYRFQLLLDVEVPEWMEERFGIFDQLEGPVIFIYEPGISPDDDVRLFKDHAILVKCYGIGIDDYFLIRVDQENQELYFHSWFSELHLYRVHKKYDY
ncbi:MAG: hypothetical protein APR63_06590 [Desulfuromonas sp. SDB]|nr:MAG: hypothetical protein APR63_06590 [Desulfuromonas sp. SDB]